MFTNNLHKIKIKLEIHITFTFICSFNNDKQEIKKYMWLRFFFFSFLYVDLYMMINKRWAEL